MAAPHWALLQRRVLDAQSDACRRFYARYFDDRGYLRCLPRWGGDDGPDDAAENLLNWPLLHALGGHDDVLTLYKQGWEGHLRQYTEAKTTEVPMGREGMYYKEFHACFDWHHHGEALSPFLLQGLSDPDDTALQRRMRRFAGLYMGDDPQAPNWDPERRLVRSLLNGSRGPLLRQATAVDWAGDPVEIEGRFSPRHRERSYAEMLEHFRDYTDVVGDHPLNLAATSLAFTAYALTGEAKYRDWVLEYVDAWLARTAANGGIVPTNIGLDGTVGGEYGWWGGCYGWGFTCDQVPYTGQRVHRPGFQHRTFCAFANALLLTGERRYVQPWRRMLDLVNANARVVDGQRLYPHMYGRDGAEPGQTGAGWYDFTPPKFAPGALELYYWTLDRSALDLLPAKPPWIAYLDGERPEYPVEALQADLELLRQQVDAMGRDERSPDCTMSDDPNRANPAQPYTLTQLMLGGLPTGPSGPGPVGYPLHCRLRYFDPVRRRAGVPQDVAALVERMTEETVSVALVNLSPVAEREVIVQGGAYAEHQILHVADGEGAGAPVRVDRPHVAVTLAPGAGARLVVALGRYANQPTLAFPWCTDAA
jgi:hypothetical protein